MQRASILDRSAAPDGVPSGVSERAAQLAVRYARLIRSVVSRVAGSGAARFGDDVEQRVLIQLLHRLRSEQEIEHPTSYVYRAAVRETVRMLRAESRAERSQAVAAELPRPLEPDPQRNVEARELRIQVNAALARLAVDRRHAVRAHLAGFEIKEIMTIYGWSYQRARNLVARGMADLRRSLRERGVDG